MNQRKRRWRQMKRQLASTITMRRAVMATAGIAVAGGVILGATEAFAASPTSSASSASTASASAADASNAASGKACKRSAHPIRCVAAKRGAHGQETVKGKAGTYVVREWQIGTVAAVGGSTITVTDGSGATWTWTMQASTKYRVDGTTSSLSAIHVGDTIAILGKQNGSANDAATVVEPKKQQKNQKNG